MTTLTPTIIPEETPSEFYASLVGVKDFEKKATKAKRKIRTKKKSVTHRSSQSYAHNPVQFHQSTSTSISPPLPSESQTLLPPTNKGYTLLSKMGWKENEGLGLNSQGIKTAIIDSGKFDRKGLGASTAVKTKTKTETYEKVLLPEEEIIIENAKSRNEQSRARDQQIRNMLNSGDYSESEEALRKGLGLF